MSDYKIVNAEKLDADLTSVANAIRKKSGATAKMEFPAGFEEAVESIPTGGVELPELGDTAAQPTDIAIGKTLYDDNGNPVTGTLYESDSIDEALFANRDFTFGGTPGGTTFSVKGAYGTDSTTGIVVRKGAGLGVRNAPTDFFGNATAGQVAKGATFTSANGLLVPGTLPDGGMVRLLVGKAHAYFDLDGGSGVLVKASADVDRIIRAGDEVGVVATYNQFGNAMPGDVRKGTTFTSDAGWLVPGELEVQSFTVTDDGEGNVTITSSAITDNNGDVVIG